MEGSITQPKLEAASGSFERAQRRRGRPRKNLEGDDAEQKVSVHSCLPQF
jgi:hypothetical protein